MVDLLPVIIVVLGAAASFGMLFALGGNDTANSIGVATGSGALPVPYAIALAASMNLIGALLAGSRVTTNVTSHVAPVLATHPTVPLNAVAYLAALFGAMTVVATGTRLGLPLSTTHAMIGGLVGAAAALHGTATINWNFLRSVSFAWLTSPLLGASLCLLLRTAVRVASPSPAAALLVVPALAAANAFAAMCVLAFVAPVPVQQAMRVTAWALPVEFVVVVVGVWLLSFLHLHRRLRAKCDNAVEIAAASNNNNTPTTTTTTTTTYGSTRTVTTPTTFALDDNAPIYRALLISAVPAIAFAHGSNDVSNGIGPFLGILTYFSTTMPSLHPIPTPPPLETLLPVLVAGGTAIALGISLFGRNVMRTVGKGGISKKPWTYAQAFCAQAAAAAAVTAASAAGVPVSTCHTIVGAVVAGAVRLPSFLPPPPPETPNAASSEREFGEGVVGEGIGGGEAVVWGGDDAEKGEVKLLADGKQWGKVADGKKGMGKGDGDGFNLPMIRLIALGVVGTPALAASLAALVMKTVSAIAT